MSNHNLAQLSVPFCEITGLAVQGFFTYRIWMCEYPELHAPAWDIDMSAQ
jgi:hypothetical protein